MNMKIFASFVEKIDALTSGADVRLIEHGELPPGGDDAVERSVGADVMLRPLRGGGMIIVVRWKSGDEIMKYERAMSAAEMNSMHMDSQPIVLQHIMDDVRKMVLMTKDADLGNDI